MADNFVTDPGAAGITFASDDIGGIHYPLTKLTFGELDSQTIASSGTGIDDAGTQRVTLATDITLPIFEPGTIDGFGHLLMNEAVNQVEIQFFRDTPANLLTVTTAGGGATSQVGGSGRFETSAAGTANAKGVTALTTSYRSASEIFVYFSALFTTPTDGNGFQRIGLYDDNNGVFVGFEGTTFGVTIRNATSDTQVAKASFSDDTLTGAVGSFFTRDGSPEAIDLTKQNVFRIRFGWLGSAPIFYEVLSPDDKWVTFHTIHQPNNAVIASMENPDLPITVHVSKTVADATNLIMLTNCWAAGVTSGALPLNEALTDANLAKIVRTIITGKNPGGAYVNITTTTAGNLKMSVQEISDGLDIGAGNAGAETQRMSISTDDVNLSAITANTAKGASHYRNIDANAEAAIKGSPGTLHWLHVMNLTAVKVYVHLYDATVENVTPGSTTPDFTFPVLTPGNTNGAGFNLRIEQAFANAITIVVTTTIDGSAGDPGTNGVFVNAGYT
jgi:hypothetical protein